MVLEFSPSNRGMTVSSWHCTRQQQLYKRAPWTRRAKMIPRIPIQKRPKNIRICPFELYVQPLTFSTKYQENIRSSGFLRYLCTVLPTCHNEIWQRSPQKRCPNLYFFRVSQWYSRMLSNYNKWTMFLKRFFSDLNVPSGYYPPYQFT